MFARQQTLYPGFVEQVGVSGDNAAAISRRGHRALPSGLAASTPLGSSVTALTGPSRETHASHAERNNAAARKRLPSISISPLLRKTAIPEFQWPPLGCLPIAVASSLLSHRRSLLAA